VSDMTTKRPVPPMTRVGILAKSNLRAAIPHLVDIEAWLADRGIEAVFETETASLMPHAPRRAAAGKSVLASTVGVVVVLGGDGTLLGMADCIGEAGSGVPILGVNFGSLGFLTEVTLPELYPALEAVLEGRAHSEERMLLQATTMRGGRVFAQQIALNDTVITKAARSRMIDLSVSVGDEFVTRVKADGLIIATPTGTTAYSLSAGGPIVHPQVDGLTITPIAPHTLTNRPVVVAGSSEIRIQPLIRDDPSTSSGSPRASSRGEQSEVFATFDGQSLMPLKSEHIVTVSRAKRPLRLIRASSRGYFQVLREKLKWGEI